MTGTHGKTINYETVVPESWLRDWLYPISRHYEDGLSFEEFLEDWLSIHWAYEIR